MPPHFLLVGNAPYGNRGCEAIVRGTMAILRATFGADVTATHVYSASSQLIARQAKAETDPNIRHVQLPPLVQPWTDGGVSGSLHFQYWRTIEKLLRTVGISYLSPRQLGCSMDLDPLREEVEAADCALQVGGDNYSLDYGLHLPIRLMHVDRALWKAGVPVVLWGASVGPFEKHPTFAKVMLEHLRGMKGVFLRESVSEAYLRSHGLSDHTRLMCDPAIMMEPIKPADTLVASSVGDGALGINFSWLMARFVTRGDKLAWVERCAEITRAVGAETGRPVLLIPHVTLPSSDDHAFLAEVQARLPASIEAILVPPTLSAAETKWVISRCSAFIGARTHSTLAALSSGIPTLSLAYSQKAIGLNQDFLGSQEYCLRPDQMTPSEVVARLSNLLSNEDSVRLSLAQVLPQLKTANLEAAESLRPMIEEEQTPRTCKCRVCRSR